MPRHLGSGAAVLRQVAVLRQAPLSLAVLREARLSVAVLRQAPLAAAVLRQAFCSTLRDPAIVTSSGQNVVLLIFGGSNRTVASRAEAGMREQPITPELARLLRKRNGW
jgi:uncharacterized protein YjbI with pentapeptide repeats